MKTYNPKIHHRKSIRLKGYDYSQAGLYFITICCQHRKHLFGKIENDEMILNDAGKMVDKWYYELENKFNDLKCREMIVMPNHIHFIVQNVGTVRSVGADLRVCPNNSTNPNNSNNSTNPNNSNILGEHIGSPLRAIVQWFKIMTTNEYIRGVKNGKYPRFDKRIWQRNYWEHIIRNENAHTRIAQYIIHNPQKWQNDKLNQ